MMQYIWIVGDNFSWGNDDSHGAITVFNNAVEIKPSIRISTQNLTNISIQANHEVLKSTYTVTCDEWDKPKVIIARAFPVHTSPQHL
jgi:hypothetical protein